MKYDENDSIDKNSGIKLPSGTMGFLTCTINGYIRVSYYKCFGEELWGTLYSKLKFPSTNSSISNYINSSIQNDPSTSISHVDSTISSRK
jgi:hypothetical protein